MALDPTDGGSSSRKMWFSIGTSIALFISSMASAKWPTITSTIPTLTTGLLSVLTVYTGGNVAAKMVISKDGNRTTSYSEIGK